MGTDVDDDLRAGFVRQRRNLMIVSLVLTFAQVADLSLTELNVLGNKVVLAQPAAILWALWVGWLYWLMRYAQYHHDIDDKSFRLARHQRTDQLVKRIALRQIKRTGTPGLDQPPEWTYRLHLEAGSTAVVYQSRWRYVLNPVLGAYPLDDDPSKKPVLEEKKGYEVTKRLPLAVAHLRAWLYVAFRTRLFSEYVLPYLVALTPVLYWAYSNV